MSSDLAASCQSLLLRVEQLEARARRWRSAATAVLSLALAGLAAPVGCAPGTAEAGGAAASRNDELAVADVLEARSFVLRNAAGGVAATLDTDPDGAPRFVLFGSPGVPSVEIWGNPSESFLRINAGEEQRIWLGGSRAGGVATMTFYGRDNKVMLTAATESDLTSLYLHGAANDKGITHNIGLFMPPNDNASLTMRTPALEKKVWTLD
ncbi:MAG TPA: hypothetical protein VGC54_07800 [Planctomycetota bacterium]